MSSQCCTDIPKSCYKTIHILASYSFMDLWTCFLCFTMSVSMRRKSLSSCLCCHMWSLMEREGNGERDERGIEGGRDEREGGEREGGIEGEGMKEEGMEGGRREG